MPIINKNNALDTYLRYPEAAIDKSSIIKTHTPDAKLTLEIINDTIKKKQLELNWNLEQDESLDQFMLEYPGLKKEFLKAAVQNIRFAQMRNSTWEAIKWLEKNILLHPESNSIFPYIIWWNPESKKKLLQIPWMVWTENQYIEPYKYFNLDSLEIISLRTHNTIWTKDCDASYEWIADYMYRFLEVSWFLYGSHDLIVSGNSMNAQAQFIFADKYWTCDELKGRLQLIASNPPWLHTNSETEDWSTKNDMDLIYDFFALYMNGADTNLRRMIQEDKRLIFPLMNYYWVTFDETRSSEQNVLESSIKEIFKDSKCSSDDILNYLKSKKLKQSTRRFLKRTYVKNLFKDISRIGDRIIDQFLDTWFDQLMANKYWHERFLKIGSQTQRQDMSEVLTRVSENNIPVGFIWGENDAISPIESVPSQYMEHFDNAPSLVIEECWHVPSMERPGKFASATQKLIYHLGG